MAGRAIRTKVMARQAAKNKKTKAKRMRVARSK